MAQDDDLAASNAEGKNSCGKSCGSKRCKDAIKKTPFGATGANKRCPGVGIGCIADTTLTQTDLEIANEWLRVGKGNTTWLSACNGLTKSKSHLMGLTA